MTESIRTCRSAFSKQINSCKVDTFFYLWCKFSFAKKRTAWPYNYCNLGVNSSFF